MPRAKTAKNPKNGNGKTVATQATMAPSGSGSQVDLEALIRQRAYELSEQRGFEPGREQEDWFTAEQQVRARHAVSGA